MLVPGLWTVEEAYVDIQRVEMGVGEFWLT
jgi:hypothetical protein